MHSLCLALLLAAEPPSAPSTAGEVLLDVGLHAGVLLGTAAIGSASASGSTSVGLSASSQALGHLTGVVPAGLLVGINPLTVAFDDYGGEAWTKAVVLPLGVGLAAGTAALAALGAWAAERLPFTEPKGTYGAAFAGAAIGVASGLVLEALLSWLIGAPQVELPLLNWRSSLVASAAATGAMAGLRLSAAPAR